MTRKNKLIISIVLVLLLVYIAITGIHQGTILYQLIQIFTSFNNILLLGYACGFLIIYIIYQMKKKVFDTGSILYLIYVISAFGSCWYYSQDKVDLFYPDITLSPLLFLFITINICLLPFWKFDTTSIKGIDDRGVSSLLNILSISFVVLSILPLLSLLSHFSLSMLEGSYLSNMYEAEDKASLYFSGIPKISFALIRRFESIVVVLFYYQLYKRNNKLALCMLLPISLFVFYKLMSGSRGGLVGSMLLLICMYLLLRWSLSQHIRSVVNKAGIIVGVVFISMMAAISISRFSQGNNNSDFTIDRWISQYMGESSIRFSNAVWDNNKLMYGNQNFILIRKNLGLPYIEDYEQFKSHYEGAMHFPVNVFYTFMGDMYLDFGIMGSIVFACIFCYLLSRLIKKKHTHLTVPKLIVLSIIFNYLGFGFAANVYRTIFIQKDMMWLLLLTFVIYMVQRATKNSSTPPMRT